MGPSPLAFLLAASAAEALEPASQGTPLNSLGSLFTAGSCILLLALNFWTLRKLLRPSAVTNGPKKT
ncbi:MAG: hypothetical protein ACE5H3_00905 [Planctomycetota bacterium]